MDAGQRTSRYLSGDFIFFLMIRLATRSTLFPYTTLFRSRSDNDFFFSWYDDHRNLHSCPTRRSSDLMCARGVCRDVSSECTRLNSSHRMRFRMLSSASKKKLLTALESTTLHSNNLVRAALQSIHSNDINTIINNDAKQCQIGALNRSEKQTSELQSHGMNA